ncbi:uncharacterized protein BO72DRAFT_54501 [Aspergillus fijiensis CBS 313.89]|uniref:Uncharacterized protein n=1 Tax=Aspergillus fijiensis CBS 313.89 TaxID=1448319 RepID=A0A8G1RV13_9EURO|nr:uncharacterized protein BO72DRAFT_54501 [Aspergillus fijiensis CBS 313.89]RAK79212.1 hypothetical protein BO72DRAFT_54501 [Aspergillus fijiensis CBS 313.89]
MHSSIHPLNPSLSLPPSLLSLTLSFSPNFIVRLSDSLEIAPVCLRHFRFSHSSIGSFHHSAGEFGGQKQNHDEWTDLQGIPFLAWWGIVRSINSCESHHPWLTDKIHAPVGCLHSDSFPQMFRDMLLIQGTVPPSLPPHQQKATTYAAGLAFPVYLHLAQIFSVLQGPTDLTD